MDMQQLPFTQYCLFNSQPFQDYFQSRETSLLKGETEVKSQQDTSIQKIWNNVVGGRGVSTSSAPYMPRRDELSLKRPRVATVCSSNETHAKIEGNCDQSSRAIRKGEIVSLKRARLSDIYASNEKENDYVPECTDSVLADYLMFKKNKAKKRKEVCVFCKNNGEPEVVFSSHVLKDVEGRTTCPILRRYVCPICSKTGDESHTIKYCPLNNGLNASAYLARACRAIGKQNF